jgi:hypothetical protein
LKRLFVRPHSGLIENAQLRVIAEWLDHTSRWFEDEVRDNRERDLVEGASNSGQVLEILTLLRPELDRMVTGFRRSADMLVAMTAPLTDSKIVPEPTSAVPRSRAHLRLVK